MKTQKIKNHMLLAIAISLMLIPSALSSDDGDSDDPDDPQCTGSGECYEIRDIDGEYFSLEGEATLTWVWGIETQNLWVDEVEVFFREGPCIFSISADAITSPCEVDVYTTVWEPDMFWAECVLWEGAPRWAGPFDVWGIHYRCENVRFLEVIPLAGDQCFLDIKITADHGPSAIPDADGRGFGVGTCVEA